MDRCPDTSIEIKLADSLNQQFSTMSPLPSTQSEPDRTKVTSIRQLRQFSNLLDRAIRIPGTSHGIGLDPILGLIPGGGDLLGAVFSGYIVLKAFQFGVPKETLLRMGSNIALETVAGTVPVVGDLFDVAWKANVKNVDLLEAHLESPETGKKADRGFVVLLLGGLLLLVILVSFVSLVAIALLWRLLQSL